MALHFKSESTYKTLVIVSALLISTIAAIFSVTGIAALFSGYYLTVATMMSVLEFGKIVVASFVSRFWDRLSVALKVYFSIAVIILIMITSGGIFGYLSDAYQKTKGNYDVIETQINLYDKKLQIFNSEKLRYEKQLSDQQKRLDNMYNSENNTNWNINTRIKDNEAIVNAINIKLNVVNDSISIYESKKTLTQAETTKGELGPLKYMANIFDTDMDTVVKYFILLLIFVFDPLAILLFVSVNVMNRREKNKKDLDEAKNDIILADDKNIITHQDNSEVEIVNENTKKDDINTNTIDANIDEYNPTKNIEELDQNSDDNAGSESIDFNNESNDFRLDALLEVSPISQESEQIVEFVDTKSDPINEEEWVDRKEKTRQKQPEINIEEFEKVEPHADNKITYYSANYKR